MSNPLSIVVRSVLYVFRILRMHADPIGYARGLGVKIGEDCHMPAPTESMFGSEPYLVKIGNNVSITHGCDFITHDGGIRQFRKIQPDIDVMGTIIIGDDVFIGAHTVLLPDTVIGDRCIIAAGSIVKGHFAPESVIMGNPARRIGSVQTYWEHIQTQKATVPTFFLNPVEKRKYLEDCFWNRPKGSEQIES